MFATVVDGKLSFLAGAGKEAVSNKVHVGKLLKDLAKTIGGGGGGRPDSANSGGGDVTRLDEAMKLAADILTEQQK
ncbi:hypothetical protein SDC9_164414 [bioreactor metagenome]|uniref:Alanine--tRNA ligase n=1 Tax=bioreactor metagenome TaxID=1076179 RepID=A0A645FRK0_9ZZZZ